MRISMLLCLAMAAPGTLGCGGGDGGTQREEIQDLTFPAFLDGNTDVEPTSVRLSDYFAENRPGTRLLMINAAAGWCSPCMREAEAMSAFADTYEPRGVAIVMGVFQDQNGDPADAEFVKAWVDTFEVSVPALIDTSFQLNEYVDVDVMPVNLFVDAESREILEVAHGAETGDDPMKEYRELLDFYLLDE